MRVEAGWGGGVGWGARNLTELVHVARCASLLSSAFSFCIPGGWKTGSPGVLDLGVIAPPEERAFLFL